MLFISSRTYKNRDTRPSENKTKWALGRSHHFLTVLPFDRLIVWRPRNGSAMCTRSATKHEQVEQLN